MAEDETTDATVVPSSKQEKPALAPSALNSVRIGLPDWSPADSGLARRETFLGRVHAG
eukprot:CAMPEP_0175940984 /NCGR_PEP_ID=MMETSP0108-20121206/24136_1 /TAXON_ID=195067 ORGANISM="Goniomonas pacifica, Strain CCMP1869" /NCGR_SAMPLE_ID=MMETSP0108 /ASSEMBLY_ACC=CAM_ASM_000204 /LENGTH=57 /DNA_ID=CAMNT_0017265569 /DNA_START=435 /DNA_END=604 /DNA_ORIENTATION=-